MNFDRYVLNRHNLDVEQSNFWLHRRTTRECVSDYRKKTSIIKQDVHHIQKLHYLRRLENVFGVSDQPHVLPLRATSNKKFPENDHQWPVFSRTKAIVKPQVAVLDLPNIRNDICSSVLEWTKSNHIIAALGKIIWIWHVSTTKISNHIDCISDVIALQAKADGTKLAFSCKDDFVCNLKVWNLETCKIDTKHQPMDCGHLHCWITCMEYHSSDKFIIIGCRMGNIGLLDHNLKKITTVRHAHGYQDVIRIKSSPDGRYVVSSGYDGYVQVWLFPSFRLVYSYYQPYCTRGLSWHPWKHSLLCVGSTNGQLALLNVALGRVLHSKKDENSIVYDVTFNKISGELVTSQTYFSADNPETYASQLNVLENFHHVVDRFDGHCRRVLYLQWSPDNHILASAGSDETIHLWKFLERKKPVMKSVTPNNLSFNLENFIR